MQELSLFANTQVEILNFQTFSTEYVAERYSVSTTAIREHKRLHADEIVQDIHFVIEIISKACHQMDAPRHYQARDVYPQRKG